MGVQISHCAPNNAVVAPMVEQWTENSCVAGSSPAYGTNYYDDKYIIGDIYMTTWTKATISQLQDTIDSVPTEYLTAATSKLKEMTTAGKTNGIPEFNDEHTIKRVWLDEAAIYEWREFIDPLDQQHGVVVVTREIVDI